MNTGKPNRMLVGSVVRTTLGVMATLTSIGLLLYSARSSNSSVTAPQLLTLPPQAHDFGIVLPLSKSKFTFTATNTFDNPLVIDRIERSCGCTSAECSPSPIPPGKEFKIDAVLSAHDHATAMTSRITVHGHAGNQPVEADYQLFGDAENIIEFPQESESCLQLGSWPADELPARTTINVVHGRYPLNFDELLVECGSSAFAASVNPIARGSWQVSFQLNSAEVLGTSGLPVTFRFARGGKLLPETVVRQAYFELLGPVCASPSTLLLMPSPGEHLCKSITISRRSSNPGEPPLQIQEVSTGCRNMIANWGRSDETGVVTLDYIAPPRPQQDRGEIIISVKDRASTYRIKVTYLAIIS